MRKRLLMLAIAGLMTISGTMTSFAGQWKQDTSGWWYQNDDGTHPNNGWNWIDGRCYYFTPEGYCLTNTQTPDNYQVDESGAWVVDGVIQTQAPAAQPTPSANQASVYQIDNLAFTVPAGFQHYETQGNSSYFMNQAENAALVVGSEILDGMDEIDMAWSILLQEIILDATIQEAFGTPQSKEIKLFPTGTWYRYSYDTAAILGATGTMVIYARLSQSRVQMVSFSGGLANINPDQIMTDCLR